MQHYMKADGSARFVLHIGPMQCVRGRRVAAAPGAAVTWLRGSGGMPPKDMCENGFLHDDVGMGLPCNRPPWPGDEDVLYDEEFQLTK